MSLITGLKRTPQLLPILHYCDPDPKTSGLFQDRRGQYQKLTYKLDYNSDESMAKLGSRVSLCGVRTAVYRAFLNIFKKRDFAKRELAALGREQLIKNVKESAQRIPREDFGEGTEYWSLSSSTTFHLADAHADDSFKPPVHVDLIIENYSEKMQQSPTKLTKTEPEKEPIDCCCLWLTSL